MTLDEFTDKFMESAEAGEFCVVDTEEGGWIVRNVSRDSAEEFHAIIQATVPEVVYAVRPVADFDRRVH